MNNLNDDNFKYDKLQVKEMIDYAIKKIEDNIYTIKSQQDEIRKLENQLENYRNSYNLPYDRDKQEQINRELRDNARKEAELIVNEAKNNANKIVNDALVRAEKIEMQKQLLESNVKLAKKKIRNVLIQQMDLVEEIEIL